MSFNTVDISKVGIYEKHGSSSYTSTRTSNGGNERSMEIEFILIASQIQGSQWYITDDDTAKEAFVSWLKTNYAGSVYDIEYDGLPLYEINVNHNGERDHCWDLRATFKFIDSDDDPTGSGSAGSYPEIGIKNIQWSSTSRAYKIYQSLSTAGGIYAPHLSSALDFQGKIGVNDGQVNGCDTIVPDVTGRISVRYDSWSQNYILSLLNAVGCVNSLAWGVFDAGSVMFTGADVNFSTEEVDDGQGGTVDQTFLDLTINIKYRPTETVSAPAAWGTGQTITKKGWQYAWTCIRKEYINGAQVDYPVQVNVENIYPTIDFNSLFLLTWES